MCAICDTMALSVIGWHNPCLSWVWRKPHGFTRNEALVEIHSGLRRKVNGMPCWMANVKLNRFTLFVRSGYENENSEAAPDPELPPPTSASVGSSFVVCGFDRVEIKAVG